MEMGYGETDYPGGTDGDRHLIILYIHEHDLRLSGYYHAVDIAVCVPK